MSRSNNGKFTTPISHMFFEIPDVLGRWCSREGAPPIRIYRQKQRGGKGYHIALAYRGGVVLRRPVYTNRGTHYFDLYGCVSMFYDSVRDVLMLSCYGNYYRVE